MKRYIIGLSLIVGILVGIITYLTWKPIWHGQKGHSVTYYEQKYQCDMILLDSNIVIVNKGMFKKGKDTLVFLNYRCGNKGKQFFRLPNDSIIYVSNTKIKESK